MSRLSTAPAATLALASHTDPKVIQQMLGHSSIVTTTDTYTNPARDGASRSPGHCRHDHQGRPRSAQILVPEDVAGLVRYVREHAAASA
jgi:integrase